MKESNPAKAPRALIIFHRIDFDGICSCAVAHDALSQMRYDIQLFPFTHGDEEPGKEFLDSFNYVCIVDVSLSPETMKRLCQRAFGAQHFRCTWIDHHKTSIEDSFKHGYDLLLGIRTNGIAACELAWYYYHGVDASVPGFIQMLSCHDVYDKVRLDWDGMTEPFQYGMRYVYGLDADKFLKDFPKMHEKAFTDKIICTGKAIYEYTRQNEERGVATYGFPVLVAGAHKGIACLTSSFGSLGFERLLEENRSTISVCVNRKNGQYKISLYGSRDNTLDLGAYCREHFGGGGHYNAAGGFLSREEFIRLIEEGVL